MIHAQTSKTRRRGAAIVEMAFVLPLTLVFIFAIYEFGRYLMVLHVTNNAAREGARFAVVNTNLGSDPTPVINVVNTRMAGIQSNLQGYTVTVFTVDPAGLYNAATQTAIYPPVIQPLAGSSWNDSKFAGNIGVQITGTYTPVLTSLLANKTISIPIFNASAPLTITAMMGSEAN